MKICDYKMVILLRQTVQRVLEKYCIVDDDNDMLENQLEKFVQTDFMVGITKNDYNKIRKILDV